MINVSQQFYFAQLADKFKPVKRIYIIRKSASSETWASAPIEVTETITKIGKIRKLTDIEEYNTWKKSSFSFDATNENGEWDIDGSLFNGYSRYKSKILIKTGLQLGDNRIEELHDTYTGFITIVDYESDIKSVKVQVEGLKKILEEADAENVGYLYTAQTLNRIDATTYRTTHSGLQKINWIKINGVPQDIGDDYSISNLGEYGSLAEAKFTFSVGIGDAVTGEYIQCYPSSYSAEYVIQKLLEEGGMTFGDYFIDDITFEGETFDTWLQTTTADFNAGTLYHIDTADDSIKMDIDGGSGKYYEKGWIISDAWDVLTAGAFDNWRYMKILPSFPGGEANIKLYTRTYWTEAGLETQTWNEVGSDGRIDDPLGGSGNWIQWKIEINNYNINNTPVIDSATINYSKTSGTVKKLTFYNFSGMSVADGLKEFLKIGNYEEGYTGSGKYYFRRRKTFLSAIELSDKKNIEGITSYDKGYDRIVNRVVANYGDYKMVRDCSGAPSSQDKYGIKKYPEDFESQLLTRIEDAPFVRNICDNIITLREEPKELATFDCEYLFTLEMGDLCPTTFSTTIDMNARIVGIVYDVMNWVMEIYVEKY